MPLFFAVRCPAVAAKARGGCRRIGNRARSAQPLLRESVGIQSVALPPQAALAAAREEVVADPARRHWPPCQHKGDIARSWSCDGRAPTSAME